MLYNCCSRFGVKSFARIVRSVVTIQIKDMRGAIPASLQYQNRAYPLFIFWTTHKAVKTKLLFSHFYKMQGTSRF